MAGNNPYLEIKDTRGVRKVPLPAGPLTIGRNFTNLLVLEEPLASRFHCVIERRGAGFWVRDLNSRNGIQVNGNAVKACEVGDGDVINIGATELKVVFTPAAAVARRPMHSYEKSEGAEPESDYLTAEEPADESEPIQLDTVEEPEAEIAPADPNAPDWERTLRERADALLNRPFRETEITLVNARGQASLAAPPSMGKIAPGAEPNILFRLVLLICFRSRATDIHVELKQDEAQVRIRVDGVMLDILRLHAADRELAVRMMSMIKVLSDIDIGQRNVVQEGSFSARVPGGGPGRPPRRVDYRVSFAPAVYGQKLVMRILDTANAPHHISDLKLGDAVAQPIQRMLQQESGMILACGPTGSGKTTTLYALLRDIDLQERNVVTIEDPVEIQLDGVTQIPVNEQQGNSFSALLKSVLRQDPDIILVGEVRDAETARIAVQSAMTGHLVFSTVHARDAIGAVYRLLDLGVEPYLVSSGLQLVLAQRLVRQLCPHCRKPVRPTSQQLATMAKMGVRPTGSIFDPKGCRRCLNTGFFGRRTVVELLQFNQALREVILKTPTMQEIIKTLGPDNYVRLAENGYQLVAEGVTSFDEVDRAVM